MTAPKPSAAELRLRALVRQWGMAMSEMDDSARAAFAADFSELLAAARAEAVAPLEARVKELEGLVESTKADFRDMQILWERALDEKDRTRDVLRQLASAWAVRCQCITCDSHREPNPARRIDPSLRAALALLAADQGEADND